MLFSMLSRFIIAFLPRSKHLLISWLQSPTAVILEPPKIKSLTVFIVSPSICREVMGLMLKLKLQHFGHLIRGVDSLEKILGQEEKGTTEDEMAGWHHRLEGHEFGWTPGVGDGQGGLVCCNSWGHKESDTTEQLNWTELMGPDAMILVFWILSFKPAFSLPSFIFIKRLFSSSSLSATRVVLSAYLRLLMFLPAILIPACGFFQPRVSHDVLCI